MSTWALENHFLQFTGQANKIDRLINTESNPELMPGPTELWHFCLLNFRNHTLIIYMDCTSFSAIAWLTEFFGFVFRNTVTCRSLSVWPSVHSATVSLSAALHHVLLTPPFYLLSSPIMDQALRGQHWSIEEPRRGFWMWTTTCTPILSTFKFNRHQKKRRRKKKISPNLFERNDKIYCCRPLGDLFSSLRCVKCVLAFFLSSVLLFKCMDGERHPPKLQS